MMIYENQMKNIQYPYKSAVMVGDMAFMNHCHQEFEIIWVTAGNLQVGNEECLYHLTQDDVLMIPPYENHYILKSPWGCERLVIQFDLNIGGSSLTGTDGGNLGAKLARLDMYSGNWSSETHQKVLGLIECMHREYQVQELAWQLAIKAKVNELCLTALREMPKRYVEVGGKQVAKLKTSLECIASHYCDDITLEGCARIAGLNPSYFSRIFKKHMDMTFQEYVKSLRVEKAKWLLLTEALSVTEVCYQSGFRDVKTFNKLFKQMCGLNPTQFRKNNRS